MPIIRDMGTAQTGYDVTLSMAEDFYNQWLGVPRGERPPHHYALLGLPLFTRSPHAIEAAVRAQMEKLDPHAMHPDRERRDIATRLMNEIAGARMVLADPGRREAYDRALAARLGVQPPSASNESEMGETIAGGAPVLDGLDVGALASSPQVEVAGGGPHSDELSDELFKSQAPLQDSDPAFTGTGRRHTTVPFSMVLVLGGVGLIVVVGIVALVIFSMAGKGTPTDTEAASTPVSSLPPPPAPKPAPKPLIESFDKAALGPAWQIKAGQASNVAIDSGSLVLSGAETPVRVDYTPRMTDQLFREASVELTIEKNVEFTFGIHTVSKAVVKRTDEGLKLNISPGNPIDRFDGSWPTLPDSATLSIKLTRDSGNVVWTVNGQTVAKSPDISPRGTPALMMIGAGASGRRVSIDSVTVIYDE